MKHPSATKIKKKNSAEHRLQSPTRGSIYPPGGQLCFYTEVNQSDDDKALKQGKDMPHIGGRVWVAQGSPVWK